MNLSVAFVFKKNTDKKQPFDFEHPFSFEVENKVTNASKTVTHILPLLTQYNV